MKDTTTNKRIISLLRVDLDWAIDDENIDINIKYGKVFDEKELPTEGLKTQITRIKEKIVDVIKEELD